MGNTPHRSCQRTTDGQTFRTVAPANYVTASSAFVPDLAKRNVRIDVRSAPEGTAYNYGALTWDSGNANEMWNGDPYVLQQMFDNHVGGCVQVGP